MRAWGSFFTSSTKKKEEGGAAQVEDVSEKPSVFRPSQPVLESGASQKFKDADRSQRSSTRPKKLYGSVSIDSTTDIVPFQRSNSNAARVAKLFGYAVPAATPEPAQVEGNAVQAVVQAESKAEERFEYIPLSISNPFSQAVALDAAQSSVSLETEWPSVIQNPIAVREKAKLLRDLNTNYALSRKDSFRSLGLGSSPTLDPKVIRSDIRAQVDLEAAIIREKRIFVYQMQAEQIRMQQEQMDLERKRILEEQSMFQRDADRFAEEERQMRLFIEEVKLEEERDRENEERKWSDAKREEEVRQGGVWQIDEDEDRGLEDRDIRDQMPEDELLAMMEVERLNKTIQRYEEEVGSERFENEDERISKQRQPRRAGRERERADWEGLRYLEEEEARRVEAQRAERADWEGLRYLEEEEARRVEAQRAEDERIAKLQAYQETVEAERLKYEEEEARSRAQRMEEERIANQQRRAQQDIAEALRYQQEESDVEVVDKEARLRKAEEKIRMAFAGLAQERGMLSPGATSQSQSDTQKEQKPSRRFRTKKAKPAGKGSKINNGDMGMNMDVERGVSRSNTLGAPSPGLSRENNVGTRPPGLSRGNTVGTRPPGPSRGNTIRAPPPPPGLSRENTVRSRPSMSTLRGGLPSGPRDAGGLPSGPRAGLPWGPRPTNRI